MTKHSINVSPERPAGYDSLAQGTFFHDRRWLEALARFYRYPILWISAHEGDRLVGALPLAEVPGLIGRRRLVSFPFSYAVGPLADSDEVTAALCTAASDAARTRRIRHVEIKRLAGESPAAPRFERHEHYSTYRIDTGGGEESVWRHRLDEGTRRSVRRGAKRNVRSVRGHTVADWTVMAKLAEITFHGHGVPPPPRGFFTELCRELQDQELADLYLARDAQNRLTASIVVWKSPRMWFYAYGASDPRRLADRPNHVVLWAALQDAIEAGAGFDLGRAAPEQKGLVDFKRRWGGEPLALAYDYWPRVRGLNVGERDRGALGAAAGIWSRLPLSVARLGAGLYRYLG